MRRWVPVRADEATRSPICDTSKVNTRVAGTTFTDTHIATLREEITRLAREADDPLTPTPLRERLRQRTTALQAIVDRHEQTRIVLAQEDHDGPDT